MLLDARAFTEGTTLETDVCIVGAGPAGLVLAAELAGTPRDVIILESGGDRMDPDLLPLNDGDHVGDEYAGLAVTRHRQVGGTSNLWNTAVAGQAGAKYAPLDAADFAERPGRDWSGWPFALDDLRADYTRAQQICGLGPFCYDAAAWRDARHEPLAGLGDVLVSRVYQLGTRAAFVAPLRSAIDRATNVRLCTNATAVAIYGDMSTQRITHVAVAKRDGCRWRVRAKCVVLAAGAVENARLLLLSDNESHQLGNISGWLGRGFMEHPRDRALTLRPRSRAFRERLNFYDLHQARDGTWIVGRFALAHDALASAELPNASATLLARPRPAIESLERALPHAVGRRLMVGGHGWSRRRGTAWMSDRFTVLLNVEQLPHPENRVTLSSRCDPLGVPLPVLHWRWRADDHARLERLRALLSRQLGSVGAVTVDAVARPDPNAHHHAGTTRMHDDPACGVTDRHGRVHGTLNVYAAGASLFPTAGFANPMLTIVALAVRLARHLVDH